MPGYSYNTQGYKVLDSTILNILQKYRNQLNFQNMGGCKILPNYILRDYSIIVNHKKIYRICKENGLLLPKRKKNKKRNKRICENRKINAPKQLWQFDIKYGYVHGENKHFFLLAIIDVFSKKIINYHIGYSCKAVHLKVTFEEALLKESPDLSELVIRSDNGTQMTSNMFRKYVDEMGLEHEFTPIRCPNKNAYVESFFSIYETQFLQVRYFENFEDAFSQTVDYIDFYNNQRLHQSILKLPPSEFLEKFYQNQMPKIEVKA